MRFFVMALALATGCTGSPSGLVYITTADTLSDGSALIHLRQAWWRPYSEGLSSHDQDLIVDAAGHAEETHNAWQLHRLARDCSDAPPSLGPCTTSSWQSETKTRSYLLPDGGRLEYVQPDHILYRSVADGTSIWSRPAPHPEHPVRGTSLLLLRVADTYVENIDIDTGLTLWRVEAPSQL